MVGYRIRRLASWIRVAACTFLVGRTFAAERSAISVPIKDDWKGYDGNWSPASIRVGTPPQFVDVFISTSSQETWVIGPGGCDGTQECLNERGGIFQPNLSTSWVRQGPWKLDLDTQLGFGGNGGYGYDSIALDQTDFVPSQIIGVVNTTEYWLGYLGLQWKPTNFTSDYKKSFLSSLVENQSLIPSHSYGYTAGAYYRLKNVPGSLTLGGYDANRFIPHNVTFDLDENDDPVVAMNEITVTASELISSNISTQWPSNTIALLEAKDAALYMIDSSTPYLWLPESVCTKFETALGLIYDENVQLYTFGTNETQHDTLQGWNLTFEFVLADLPRSSKSVTLSLPYSAFDLQLRYPMPNLNATEYSGPVNYFPLRKAANDTQFTIGRAFLQEAYLMVDYERHNFSVYQAKFSTDALRSVDLVDILRPKNSTLEGPHVPSTGSFSKAAVAGIVIGAIAAIVLSVFLATLCLRLRWFRRHRRKLDEKQRQSGSTDTSRSSHGFRNWRSWFLCQIFCLPKPDLPEEIDGNPLQRHTPSPPPTRRAHPTVAFREPMELPASAPTELHGDDLGMSAYEATSEKVALRQAMSRGIPARGHDPQRPVELPYRASTAKTLTLVGDDSSPTESNKSIPSPYSPDRVGQGTMTTVGISSQSHDSSVASSPMIVSPVTPHQISPVMPSLSTIANSNESPEQRLIHGWTNGWAHRHGSPGSRFQTSTEEGSGSSASYTGIVQQARAVALSRATEVTDEGSTFERNNWF